MIGSLKQTAFTALIIIGAISALPLLSYSLEPVEKIIAVVGNEPITASELAAEIQMLSIQGAIKPENQAELEKLQTDILERMISEKLFLIEARKDTSIKVTPEEINQSLDEHIAKISSQFESEDQFIQQLSREGMTLRSYKKRLQPEIENQLLKQKLISNKLSKISISKQEVLDFYNKYKDSIPEQPEAIRLAHILITFQPSGVTEDSVKRLADKVRQNAMAGADFATLATTYSSGPTALNGGDLGFISPEDVVPEFGKVAFGLSPGEISGAIRTQFGYHIIKSEEIRGKQAHLRHILFEVKPTKADSLLSYKLVDSLLTELRKGADFKELAKVYSADDDSRKQGGELGWFALKDLPAGFALALDSLKNIGDFYGPVLTDYGLHILKKLDWQEGRVLNPDADFDRIKEMARQSKTGEYVDRWLQEIRQKTYVEIRKLN